MSGWNDYFVTSPVLCDPTYIMKGINSALCERREAVDSAFYSSCSVNGGVSRSAIYDSCFRDIVVRTDSGTTESDYHFNDVQRKYSFYAQVDSALNALITSSNNKPRAFIKQDGSYFSGLSDLAAYAYDNLDSNAKNLTTRDLIMGSDTVYYTASDWNHTTFEMTPLFQSEWAIQRRNMLNALVYTGYNVMSAGSEPFLYLSAYHLFASNGAFASTPQGAYDSSTWTGLYITSGGMQDVYDGYDKTPACSFSYSVWPTDFKGNRGIKIIEIRGNTNIGWYQSNVLTTNNYALSLDIIPPPVSAGGSSYSYFNNMGLSNISSGINLFTADSNGVFCHWDYSSYAGAVMPEEHGGGTSGGSHVLDTADITEGWYIQNAYILYDYTNTFTFKK